MISNNSSRRMRTQHILASFVLTAVVLFASVRAQPLRGVSKQFYEVNIPEQQQQNNANRDLLITSAETQECVDALRDIGGTELSVSEFLEYLLQLTPNAPSSLKELPAPLLAAFYATACAGARLCAGPSPSIDLSPTPDDTLLHLFCHNVNSNVKQAISLTFRYLIRYDENLSVDELWSRTEGDTPSVASSLATAARRVLLDYLNCAPDPEVEAEAPIPISRDMPLSRARYVTPFTILKTFEVSEWARTNSEEVSYRKQRQLAGEAFQMVKEDEDCRFDVDTSVVNMVQFEMGICEDLMGGALFDGMCALVVQQAVLTVKDPTDILSKEEVGVWRNFILDTLAESIDTGAFEKALP